MFLIVLLALLFSSTHLNAYPVISQVPFRDAEQFFYLRTEWSMALKPEQGWNHGSFLTQVQT